MMNACAVYVPAIVRTPSLAISSAASRSRYGTPSSPSVAITTGAEGALPRGVTAKDLVLAVIGRIGVAAGDPWFFDEYA